MSNVDDRLRSRQAVKEKLINRVQTMKHSCLALERIAQKIELSDADHADDIFSYIKETTAFREHLIQYHRAVLHARNTMKPDSPDKS